MLRMTLGSLVVDSSPSNHLSTGPTSTTTPPAPSTSPFIRRHLSWAPSPDQLPAMSTANQLTRDESRNSIELEKATATEKKLDFMGRDPDQPKTPWAVMKYMFDWVGTTLSFTLR